MFNFIVQLCTTMKHGFMFHSRVHPLYWLLVQFNNTFHHASEVHRNDAELNQINCANQHLLWSHAHDMTHIPCANITEYGIRQHVQWSRYAEENWCFLSGVSLERFGMHSICSVCTTCITINWSRNGTITDTTYTHNVGREIERESETDDPTKYYITRNISLTALMSRVPCPTRVPKQTHVHSVQTECTMFCCVGWCWHISVWHTAECIVLTIWCMWFSIVPTTHTHTHIMYSK